MLIGEGVFFGLIENRKLISNGFFFFLSVDRNIGYNY